MVNDLPGSRAPVIRGFGWCMLAVLAAFLIDNYLTLWHGLPGSTTIFRSGAPGAAWAQAGIYGAGILLALLHVLRAPATPLRSDARRIHDINSYFVRGAFWGVLLVGVVDCAISFLRIEDLLPVIFGDDLAHDLGKSAFRGAWVHWPLVLVGFVCAAFSRSIGFHWLAILVVIAELLIVIARFVFSYEQAFMADLVRFWYAALFLFASAYTLAEEGHVRVDVVYAGLTRRRKGLVNAIGTLLLGITLCWVILAIGMGGKSTIINSPLLAFEVTQAGFGLYLKYFMAGFLAVFAISMLIQFVSYFLEAVADMRDEPGRREPESPAAH